jgi:hypothetical protein
MTVIAEDKKRPRRHVEEFNDAVGLEDRENS